MVNSMGMILLFTTVMWRTLSHTTRRVSSTSCTRSTALTAATRRLRSPALVLSSSSMKRTKMTLSTPASSPSSVTRKRAISLAKFKKLVVYLTTSSSFTRRLRLKILKLLYQSHIISRIGRRSSPTRKTTLSPTLQLPRSSQSIPNSAP